MNARVKPAAFMPLFATSTTEGPASYEALIAQMMAAGMVAGAWMVEGLVQHIETLEGKVKLLDDLSLGEIKGESRELHKELGNLANGLKDLVESLANVLNGVGFKNLYAEVSRVEEVVESLVGEVGILEGIAFSIYNAIDV